MEDELISETGKHNKYCLAHQGQKKKKKKSVYKELIQCVPAWGPGISRAIANYRVHGKYYMNINFSVKQY
jgi:hypothetical protein